MISNIRTAFIEMLNKSTWMDDVSKHRAIEKVNKEMILSLTFD
jgi:predicted metalloendopeptidase